MFRIPRRYASSLKDKFGSTVESTKQQILQLRNEYGHIPVKPVTISQALTGMRGVPALLTETSRVDPFNGIRFRGYSIPECQKLLPAFHTEPMPESLFWLLLTGKIPTKAEAEELRQDFGERALQFPKQTKDLIDSLPTTMHPMVQYSIGVLSLSQQSQFNKAFNKRIAPEQHWEYVYEDALNLCAWSPLIAARIYRNTYFDRRVAEYNPDLDLGGNFGKQLGWNDPAFDELMRLYIVIHSDHEGGNVSAHTTHLVHTTLSDVFRSFSAGLNGLAGPLHGLANQECLKWLLDCQEVVGLAPTHEAVEVFVKSTLASGKVVPGFGHAVLRNTDPRYTCQIAFGNRVMENDPLFNLVKICFDVIPKVLKATGKVSNPWPNVDAASGTLLTYYKLDQFEYFTVLFGVARTLGVMADAIWSRAMLIPLERPESVTVDELEVLAGIRK